MKILTRQNQNNDDANKWLSVRGTELFYLDFKDLGAVMREQRINIILQAMFFVLFHA
nr:MAG TPA: hypothetical protein [Caudoviricetes sp.]